MRTEVSTMWLALIYLIIGMDLVSAYPTAWSEFIPRWMDLILVVAFSGLAFILMVINLAQWCWGLLKKMTGRDR